MHAWVACAGAFFLACTPVHAAPPPAARQAAEAGLRTLRGVVAAEDFRDMGFESLAQARSAVLGPPFRVLTIDDVIWCPEPEDMDSLLTEYNYTAVADGKERAVIAVEKLGGTWTMTSLGGANYLRNLLAASNATGSPRDSVCVLRMPVVANYFVARRVAGVLWLTPAWASSRLGLAAHQEIPADSVVVWLRRIDDLNLRLREHR